MRQIKLQVQGVASLENAQKVETTIKQDAGVTNVKVSSTTGKAIVQFDEDVTSLQEIVNYIQGAGAYHVEHIADDISEPAPRQSIYQKYTAKQLFFGGLLIPSIIGILAGGAVLAKNISWGFGTAEEHHIRGNKDSAVKVVEYADFQCPFCGRFYPTVQQLVKDYGDKISFEYKHFPLSFHPYAEKAAEASECASEQGKFWQFHDYAFEHQDSLSFDALKQWAKNLGLNATRFNQCLDSGKYAVKVQAEEKEGEGLGVNGTPTTFVNGKPVVGAVPYETIKQAVDDALNAKK